MRVEALTQIAEFTEHFVADRTAEIEDGYVGDLLSDVMANAPPNSVLITIQAHKNTIAVASLVGITALVICNGRAIADEMTRAAQEEEISLFRTDLTQFEATRKLIEALDGTDAGSR
jgi:Mg2+/Co2+ transporter CorC